MNPFNDTLDWTFQGKYTRVYGNNGRVYEGFVDRVHHNRGSVVIHNAVDVTEEFGTEEAAPDRRIDGGERFRPRSRGNGGDTADEALYSARLLQPIND